MSQSVSERSQEEREFWERQFDAPSRTHRVAGSGRRSRRSRRRSDAPAPVFDADPVWRRGVEWLRDRRGDPRIGVVVLVLIAVVAGFVWYRIGIGGDDASAAAPAPKSATASGADPVDATPKRLGSSGSTAIDDEPEAEADDGPIVVHVAGAVTRPGVVELVSTARVIDAVEAVGGARADGDLDRLNLAARVGDGARIYVPVRGQADPGVLAPTGDPPTGTTGSTGTTGGAAVATPSPEAKLDLNTATQAQLEALPGIGPAYALAIIAERARRGGFTSVNELREVRGIGEQRFADVAPLVTV